MKLYLAAPWADKDQMKARAAFFLESGYTITHEWWATDDVGEGSGRDEQLGEHALNDYTGVLEADILVLFNTVKSEGKAVEQGLAIGNYKPVIAIGKLGDGTAKNVFHYLPFYLWVPTIAEALDALRAINTYKLCKEELQKRSAWI